MVERIIKVEQSSPYTEYKIPCNLSSYEYNIIQRLRQLFKLGVDIIIIEKRNGKPKLRTVGKPEG